MFSVLETNRSDINELAESATILLLVHRIQKEIYESMYVKDKYSSMVLKTPSRIAYFRCLKTKVIIVKSRAK